MGTWNHVLFPKVGFIGEMRPKRGGVASEFFHAVFEEMTEAKYELFTYPEEGSYMWFPANVSPIFKNIFF